MITDTALYHLLAYNDEWVFCHIPKNGGRNFKNSYRIPNAPKKENDLIYHQPPSWWEKNYPEIKGRQWICISRNPYSRYVSWFFFIQHRYKIGKYKSGNWDFCSFKDFVKLDMLKTAEDTIAYKSTNSWRAWNLTSQQSYWYNDISNIKVFSLENDLHEMEEYTKVKFAHSCINKTDHKPYEYYYTQELGDIVYEKFKSDFDIFGYKKEFFLNGY